jgi:hypothetical protein
MALPDLWNTSAANQTKHNAAMRGKIEVAVLVLQCGGGTELLPAYQGEIIIMTELTWSDAKYSVILRSDIPALEAELLSHFCSPITSKTGEALLHFLCTEIDPSHPFYVRMTTFKPKAEFTRPIQIPHHYVFLISGSDSDPYPIGFDLTT